MSEVIVFTSGKGGVGKSNLCLNTALQLTALQYRSCLFDGDLGLANVNILLGIEQEYTLDDLLFNDKSIDEILVHTGYGFDIIPGSSGVEQIANLTAEQLQTLIAALTSVADYDYFLIDTASGISRSVISFCMAAQQTVIVITREATSLTDAYAFIKLGAAAGMSKRVSIVANQAPNVLEGEKTYKTLLKACENFLRLTPPLAGIVRQDPRVKDCIRAQTPILTRSPNTEAAQDVESIASYVESLLKKAAAG